MDAFEIREISQGLNVTLPSLFLAGMKVNFSNEIESWADFLLQHCPCTFVLAASRGCNFGSIQNHGLKFVSFWQRYRARKKKYIYIYFISIVLKQLFKI